MNRFFRKSNRQPSKPVGFSEGDKVFVSSFFKAYKATVVSEDVSKLPLDDSSTKYLVKINGADGLHRVSQWMLTLRALDKLTVKPANEEEKA